MKQKFSRLLTFCLAFIMTFQMGMLSAAEAVSDELPRFTENDLVFSGQTLSNAFLGVGNNSSEVVDGNVRFFTQPGGSNSRQYVHTLDQGVEYEAYSHLVVRLKNTGIGGNAMLRIGSSAGDYYQFNYSAVQGESEYRDMVFSLDTPSAKRHSRQRNQAHGVFYSGCICRRGDLCGIYSPGIQRRPDVYRVSGR